MPRASNRFFVRSLTTVPGAHTYSQKRMREAFEPRIEKLEGYEAVRDTVRSVFENSTVDTRHLEIAVDELDRKREGAAWSSVLNEAVMSILSRATTRALGGAIRPADCDALICVTSLYDGLPAPSRRLVEQLGFRQDTLFYDLAHLGCGGANHGIHLAHMLLETGRCKTVCVVAADVLNSHIHLRRYSEAPNASEIVARALPSDGAAALVLAREPGDEFVFSYEACDWRMHSWRDSNEYAHTKTTPDGEPHGELRKELRTRVLEESSGLLADVPLTEPLFVHPGGIALLKRLVEAHPHLHDTTEISKSILRENGNMSAPTVLFVLARALERAMPLEPRFRLLAMGPGIYSSLLRFDGVERRR